MFRGRRKEETRLGRQLLQPVFALQVVRAAEEAASTLAASVHPEQCIKVLCPIVQTADYPVNLAAIKMQTRAIERTAREPLHQLLSDIIPGLLQVRPPTLPRSSPAPPPSREA